jgi:hypothetical protein
VGEVREALERLLDHAVRRSFAQLSHEAHAAGIVLLSLVKSATPITVRIFSHRSAPSGSSRRTLQCALGRGVCEMNSFYAHHYFLFAAGRAKAVARAERSIGFEPAALPR